jgi:sulfofructosephosphate aldolase
MSEQAIRNLAMSNGGYAMLALDQRESLRQMMSNGQNREISNVDIVNFKADALNIFATQPSAVLLDVDFGVDAYEESVAEQPPIILAIDLLHHASDGKLFATSLATDGIERAIERVHPQALKFLMLWSENETPSQRLDLAGSFVDFCKLQELPAVLESIVRPKGTPVWSDPRAAADAMVIAADELSIVESDLFKCEVPGHGKFGQETTIEYAKQITLAIGSPWVVLSNGVSAIDFPDAVSAACKGGASGFLAGRAIWADAVKEKSASDFLKNESTNRFKVVQNIVSAEMAQRLPNEASA